VVLIATFKDKAFFDAVTMIFEAEEFRSSDHHIINQVQHIAVRNDVTRVLLVVDLQFLDAILDCGYVDDIVKEKDRLLSRNFGSNFSK
jgi:hypothetical protein